MSKVADLMQEIKDREGVTTNYRLAKLTGIPENRLSDYAKGIRTPDEYAATRLALALGLEPIEVIAQIQAETEKNEQRREFWRNFLTRAACIAGLAVPLSFGFPCENARAELSAQTNNIQHKHTLCEALRKCWNACQRWLRRHADTPELGVAAVA